MPDHKEMYLKLFNSITKAITILQEAQQQTEEMYISKKLPDIRLVDFQRLEKTLPDKEE